MSSCLSTIRATAAVPRRSCLSVQCRRLSKQTSFLQRSVALPRRSRATASNVRFLSTKHSDLSLPKASNDAAWKTQEGPDGPDLNLRYVKAGGASWHPVFLRDTCICPHCVDPSSKQKKFQTTDIPKTIEAKTVQKESNGDVTITWTEDAPGFGPDHLSRIPASLFASHQRRTTMVDARYHVPTFTWNKKRLTEKLAYVDFEEYMHDEKRLLQALNFLQAFGILLVRGVPETENAIEHLTSRIGRIRDTFYGRTWDVKSVPNAKNVAYTQQHLGLHMDLLYMQNPPGLQFLHCLKNTSPGGNSLFSDGLRVAHRLDDATFNLLARQDIAFEYRNDGQHYYKERPVLEVGKHKETTFPGGSQKVQRAEVLNINWSPPFQAPLPFQAQLQGSQVPRILQALRTFAYRAQDPEAVYEHKLSEGECVIFNNRRVLHGRTAFDATQGERWLKGTYVDSDVFESRLRVLQEQFQDDASVRDLSSQLSYVNPEGEEAHQKMMMKVNGKQVDGGELAG